MPISIHLLMKNHHGPKAILIYLVKNNVVFVFESEVALTDVINRATEYMDAELRSKVLRRDW